MVVNIICEVVLIEILPNNAATVRSFLQLPSVPITVKSEVTTNYRVSFGPLVLKLLSEGID